MLSRIERLWASSADSWLSLAIFRSIRFTSLAILAANSPVNLSSSGTGALQMPQSFARRL